jgi:hypothetical protein
VPACPPASLPMLPACPPARPPVRGGRMIFSKNNDFLKNQEINQVNKIPTKHMNLRITALPKSFQIDMVYYPIGESLKKYIINC